METGFLSLDELFHVEDSQITRAWFESTSLTPLEAIEKAEEHHELQEKVDDLLKNLHDEQELRLRMEERISKLSACLDSLRVRAFGADTFRQSSEFDDEFMFCEQDSQTLNDFWAPYCPDLHPTAAMFKITDGELDELWVTESNDYFSVKTIYMRVY